MTDSDLSTLYAEPHSQTADDHPPEIIPEAQAFTCPDHPDDGWTIGFGYAGGGFGHYKRCKVCKRVFGKVAAKG
jgi:hypothetical protein